MTSDSEFVAFSNHAIQLALDLIIYPNIWAVLSILLETQDVNTMYMQVMHDYYYRCYNTKMKEYMIELEEAAENLKYKMYNNDFDRVSADIQLQVCGSQMHLTNQQDIEPKNCTHIPLHAHFNDILTEYTAWLMNTNDIENTNQVQYREHRQEILNAWQKDTPVKMPDNRQILDNVEAYSRDKQNITQSLNHRLGLTESSLPGTQVTVATVQSDQLTTDIPNYSPNRIAKCQQDDLDYQDGSDEEIYQVDGTMDIHTPTDNSDDDEDNELDNKMHKR